MLYNKNIKPMCAYCLNAQKGPIDNMICKYKGVVSQSYSCRKYTYDPIKRRPSRRPKPAFADLDPISIDK